VALRYRFEPETTLRYRYRTSFTRRILVPDRPIEITLERDYTLALTPQGRQGDAVLLEVTIESLAVEIRTPLGTVRPDVSGLQGRALQLVLTPQGKELHLRADPDLRYPADNGTTRAVSADFQDLFPDLPVRDAAPGREWRSSHTRSERNEHGALQLETTTTSALAGAEGRTALIESHFQTTLRGETRLGNTLLALEGAIQGTGRTRFAARRGVLLEHSREGSGRGALTNAGAESRSYPLELATRTTITLLP
jgi:hypothetical protein